MAVKAIAVGRYARATNAARIDVIGKVVRHTGVGAVLLVPNWKADGYPMEWHARWEDLERSTAKACRDAADRRGR